MSSHSKKGLSLNEHGIKNVKSGKVTEYVTEEDFYHAIGLAWIPPEIREDRGEIEAAQKNLLPQLVQLRDIRGDFHIHSDYDLTTSHDIGANTLIEHLDRALELGYTYIGFSDHNPRVSSQSINRIREIMKKRCDYYQTTYTKWQKQSQSDLKMFVMCEVDIQPDGTLALPESAFEYVDGVIVSLHSAFTQAKDTLTARIEKALMSHPKVRIFGHPTGRLLGSREGADIDWNRIFAIVKERDIALEINAFPERLDLPDNLVYDAVHKGVKLCINTDAHALPQMDLMQYGVSVARRGWAEKKDIVNTYSPRDFAKWFSR